VTVRILLLCGSLREGSTNAALLRTAAAVAPDGIVAERYGGLAELPPFNPDDDVDPLPAAVVDLRARIADADAVLCCTPEYAGGLPGSFKNLLDWTVGGTETSDKPFAWVNAAGRPDGAIAAHDGLRRVLTYTDARIVDAACVRIPVPRDDVGPDGLLVPAERRARVVACLTALAAAVHV
jgi:chromate reductase